MVVGAEFATLAFRNVPVKLLEKQRKDSLPPDYRNIAEQQFCTSANIDVLLKSF